MRSSRRVDLPERVVRSSRRVDVPERVVRSSRRVDVPERVVRSLRRVVVAGARVVDAAAGRRLVGGVVAKSRRMAAIASPERAS
jgi:hypothetical protein